MPINKKLQPIYRGMADGSILVWTAGERKVIPKLTDGVKKDATDFISSQLPEEHKLEVVSLVNQYGHTWHLFASKEWLDGIKAKLRGQGISDGRLPTHNWDDYLAECIELACNVEGGMSSLREEYEED
jgi:hypothetical protein